MRRGTCTLEMAEAKLVQELKATEAKLEAVGAHTDVSLHWSGLDPIVI